MAYWWESQVNQVECSNHSWDWWVFAQLCIYSLFWQQPCGYCILKLPQGARGWVIWCICESKNRLRGRKCWNRNVYGTRKMSVRFHYREINGQPSDWKVLKGHYKIGHRLGKCLPCLPATSSLLTLHKWRFTAISAHMERSYDSWYWQNSEATLVRELAFNRQCSEPCQWGRIWSRRWQW